MRVPPLVGSRELAGHVLGRPLPLEVVIVHPIGTGVSWPLSFFFIKEMEKKYLQSSKWGSIPRYPSHIAMKVAIC